jgi:diamine N-acetyltransferase
VNMNVIQIELIDKQNWEEACSISLFEDQVKFVPAVIESLAYAYIKPWDEAFDPYILKMDNKVFGFFYVSYTPDSKDNYWLGGFQIDKEYQGKGIAVQSLISILEFIKEKHMQCEVISLTVEENNYRAKRIYEKLGFINREKENQDGEIIYKLRLR